MRQYIDLLNTILTTGTWQENRTGIKTISVPGAALRFDLKDGFPAVTTRKLAFKTAIGELVGFLRGYKSAAEFRSLGCKVWDQNANENTDWLANPYREGIDDIGGVYGVQWRGWPAYKVLDESKVAQVQDATARGFQRIADFVSGDQRKLLMYKPIDQLRQCLDTIINNPTDRRIIFHAWNCAQLDQMALPPCHLLYQFLPNIVQKEISLCLYVRSNDMGLGAPFNLAEGAALLHLVGRLTGYAPRWFSYFIGDAHIYENQLEMIAQQITRQPLPAPQLRISDRIQGPATGGAYAPEWLEMVEPDDFSLDGYEHHPSLSAPMAV